jgi:hypothetical protein
MKSLDHAGQHTVYLITHKAMTGPKTCCLHMRHRPIPSTWTRRAGYKAHFLEFWHTLSMQTLSVIWLIDWKLGSGLSALMHLGFNWRALCASCWVMGTLLPCQSSRWSPHLYYWYPLAPRKRSPMCTSERSKGFTFTKDMGRGFILCSTPPTQ